VSYEFGTNSPRPLTPISDANLAGPHWANRWLTGPLARPHAGGSKGRPAGLVPGIGGFWPTAIERNRKPFLFPNVLSFVNLFEFKSNSNAERLLFIK
jgi:hypothetical protein